jgi:hypothetical protein
MERQCSVHLYSIFSLILPLLDAIFLYLCFYECWIYGYYTQKFIVQPEINAHYVWRDIDKTSKRAGIFIYS